MNFTYMYMHFHIAIHLFLSKVHLLLSKSVLEIVACIKKKQLIISA